MAEFKMSINDTICAIATPPGQGGIGIVRVSGNGSPDVIQKIWKGKKSADIFESHRMYLGRVVDPQTKEPIDTALAVLMRAPNSYTGENVVEISCHGSAVILGKILEACKKAGARLAEPGEFTKRAFLNGKMDLAQAEAVADLISATSESASRCARDQLEGGLSRRIGELIDELTNLRAFVEASIDFPEEDIEFIEQEGIAKRLGAVASKIVSLADTYNEGKLFKDGVNVVIIGKPNVGKSSLFNALVGHERAIVHHTSGTTRDLVKETVQIGGVAFHLTDAAGLRESDHDIEKMGILKARDAIERADLILFVMDGSKPSDDSDKEIFNALDKRRAIVCVNKSDLPAPLLCKEGSGEVDRGLPHLTSPYKGEEIAVSALRGDGIDLLKEKLLQSATGQKEVRTESAVVTSARHKEALHEAIGHIENAIKATNERQSAEFIAHHLSLAHDCLGQITGKVATEAVLDRIFSSFCIGK